MSQTGTIGQQAGGNNVILIGSHCVLDVSSSSANPSGTTLSVFLSLSFLTAGSYGAYGEGRALGTVDGPYSGILGSLNVTGGASANTGIIVQVPSPPSYYVLNDGVARSWNYCLADVITHVCFNDAAHNGKYVSDCVADAGGYLGGLSSEKVPLPRDAIDSTSFGLKFTANSRTATGNRGITCRYAPYYDPNLATYPSSGNAITVYDATPKLTNPPLPPYDPDETGSFYITLYGTNLGPSQGSLSVCSDSTGSCNDFVVSLSGQPYATWGDNQVNALLTPLTPAASEGGKYNMRLTSVGESGAGFLALQEFSQAQSTAVQMTFPAVKITPDVVVIGWVNSTAITLPDGASMTLQAALNLPVSCSVLLGYWALSTRADLFSSAEVDYANAWLLLHSGNTMPPDIIDPAAVLAGGDFRLFNRLKSKYFQSSSRVSTPAFLQSAAVVGDTPDPCGLIPNSSGEDHPSNGSKGVTSSGTGVYQLAEGRLGSIGQTVNMTINGTTTPWIWSAIRFDLSGNLAPLDHSIFPTYFVYINGVRSIPLTFPQSAPAAFIRLNDTYQRLPFQIP